MVFFILIALKTYRLSENMVFFLKESENMVGPWNSMNRINRTTKKLKKWSLVTYI